MERNTWDRLYHTKSVEHFVTLKNEKSRNYFLREQCEVKINSESARTTSKHWIKLKVLKNLLL